MSGKQQMEDMVQSWTKMQKDMWDNWMQSVRQFGGTTSMPGTEDMQAHYQEQLKSWEASVRQALDAQAQWASQLSDQAKPDQHMPEAVQDWSARMQEMMKSWTDSQEKLWSAWFESMRKMDPEPGAKQWEEQSRQVMEAWQQAAQRAQDTLQQWGKMAQQPASGKKKG